MSMFTDSIGDAHMSFMDDAGFEESDIDSTTSDQSMNEAPPKDYWFGRKYFECVLAQNILQTSRLYNSIAQVDVSFSCMKQHELTCL